MNGCSRDTLLTVSAATQAGTISSDSTVCAGSNTGTLTLAGQVGTVVRWESSIDGGFTWIPISNTNTTQAYSNLSTTTKYRALVQNGGCTSLLTNEVTITVNPAPTVYTLSGGGFFCTGGSGVSITLSGSQVGIRYNFFLGATNIGFLNGNGSPLTLANVTAPGTYTVVATSLATNCSTNMSGSASVGLIPLPTASINQAGPLNVCAPATQTLTTS